MKVRKRATAWQGLLGAAIFLGVTMPWLLARAQEEALVVHPPLSQCLPLSAAGGEVRLQFPVLLNDHTVVGADAVLRFMYVDPNAGIKPRGGGGGDDKGESRGVSTDGGTANLGPKNGSTPFGTFKDDPDAGDKKAKKILAGEAYTEVWNQPDLFREALDHAADLGTTLVYGLPGKAHPQSVVIDFPEGLFLGEVNGHVKVLGLTDDSRALEGGVQPGDEIRSLQGTQTVATLQDFLKAYLAIKQAAQNGDQPAYTIEVWRPSEGKAITIQVEAPPSIHSML